MIAGPAHLKALEAESIRIFREIAAQSVRPVMLYSIGKDSSVLLHLARKAFFPARPPFRSLLRRFRENDIFKRNFKGQSL